MTVPLQPATRGLANGLLQRVIERAKEHRERKLSSQKLLEHKKPELYGLGRRLFQQKLKSDTSTEQRQPFWLLLIRIAEAEC